MRLPAKPSLSPSIIDPQRPAGKMHIFIHNVVFILWVPSSLALGGGASWHRTPDAASGEKRLGGCPGSRAVVHLPGGRLPASCTCHQGRVTKPTAGSPQGGLLARARSSNLDLSPCL